MDRSNMITCWPSWQVGSTSMEHEPNMDLDHVNWEDELQEQFSFMSTISEEAGEDNKRWGYSTGGSDIGMMSLSEEVIICILRNLDPTSLLRVGSTCQTLFRICSCNSLWTKHFQVSFGVQFVTATCSVTAKAAFRVLFMWRTLFRNLHCNRSMQERLFAEVPFPPQRYWTQWLVVEGTVPLPSVRLASPDIQELWGLEADVLKDKVKDKDEEGELMKFEWKELHDLAVERHGGLGQVYQHVLNKQHCHDHTELETLFHQYTQCRFQWLFSYWLFRQPPPFDRQLRSVFLQWRRYNKSKVATWGGTLCDVRYLASLHPITADYWRGRLARGDETLGIQSVEGYFSMCRSLVAWILGRDWGRLKRRKVYEDTLDGVYLVLRRELQDKVVEHQRFWQVAKVQMTRVCTLEESAANYVNWRMIENLPYYKLYMVSGNPVYLNHVQGFLQRKRLVHDWIHLEENIWVRQLLPEALTSLLEYHHKIPQASLHGESVLAQMSRVVWLYLNSGQQLYLEAVKGLVLQYAQADLACYRCHSHGLSLEQAS